MRKVRFIYNPTAGETSIPEHLDRIVALYQEQGLSLVPYRLTFDGTEQSMIDDIDPSYHHVLVAGGDGTVNFVLNLMKRKGIDIPLAVLPTGTANDFAKVVGMPSDPEEAVRTILSGDVRPVDLGLVNGTYFVNVCSCGLFTNVSQHTPTLMKNAFGKLAYIAGGAADLAHLHKMKLRISSDGGDFEGEAIILLIFNGKTAGNFKLAHLSEVDDGLLDVLIVKGDSPIETIHTFFLYLSGIGSNRTYPREIVHIKCSHLRAETDTAESTDIDGESGPDFPLDVRCVPGGIRMIRPTQNRTRFFPEIPLPFLRKKQTEQ